jgi:hypothetical protein
LDDLSRALNSHLVAMAQHKWGVEKYFSGFGPIAVKLKDYAAISTHYAIGSYKLGEQLKKFDFSPVTDEAQGKVFRRWLEDVAINAFGQPHDIELPLPYTPGVEIGLSTGIHTLAPETYAPDAEIPRYLVLAVDMPTGMRVKYIVRRHGRAILLYWHPHEEVWLADAGGVIFEGVQEALAVEWEKLATQSGYTSVPVNIETNMESIQEKAYRLFDKEEHLPESARYYYRDPDGQSSYVRFMLDEYALLFMNTKGQYPSRNALLSITSAGSFNTKIEWTQMREFARQELFKIAHAGLDEMLSLAAKNEATAEVPDEPVVEKVPGIGEGEVAHSTAAPDYTPVYLRLQRSAKKEGK